jgi:putative molybdopterin biosynthesis protein
LAAANALNLDFIPVSPERYDLAIPREYFDLDSIQKMLRVINTDDFKQKVEQLGGYDTSKTGSVINVDSTKEAGR